MKPWWLLFVLHGVALVAYGQGKPDANAAFTLAWSEGKCIRCETADELGRTQFVSRSEAWAVGFTYGPPGSQGSGDFIVVHTKDAGHTWREVPGTGEHAGDADGPPAFSFLDARRGWIAWTPDVEAKLIRTRDGGQHWERVRPPKYSQVLLQKLVFFDESRAYGTAVAKFLQTSDGGRNWKETQIPHLRFIDRMFFLSPEIGWLAGTDGKDFFVFRTTNGGNDWEESRTTPPEKLADVRDLFFLDQNRGWLITWQMNDGGTYLFSTGDGGKTWTPESDLSFQGKGKWAAVVRFVSEKTGLVFESNEVNSLFYTSDGGAHWSKQTIPHSVSDCQVFEGDVLCSAGNGASDFSLLTVHMKSLESDH